MAATIAIEPGQPAPIGALYHECRADGSRTGISVMADQGQPLPPLPRGDFWQIACERALPERTRTIKSFRQRG